MRNEVRDRGGPSGPRVGLTWRDTEISVRRVLQSTFRLERENDHE